VTHSAVTSHAASTARPGHLWTSAPGTSLFGCTKARDISRRSSDRRSELRLFCANGVVGLETVRERGSFGEKSRIRHKNASRSTKRVALGIGSGVVPSWQTQQANR
jgi:hypothetical protein